MLTFILSGTFFIAPLAIVIVQYVKENDYTVPVIFWLAIAFLLNLGIYASLVNIGKEFEYTIEKYGNLKTLVEEYNETVDSTGYPELEYDIRKQVVDMNNEISEHKVMRKSIWKGPWYSKEIGDLPKLSVKRKTKQP